MGCNHFKSSDATDDKEQLSILSSNVFSHHLSTMSCHMVTAFVLLGRPPNSAIHFHSFRSISAEKKDSVGETQRVWPVAFFPGFTIKLLLEFKRPCPSFGR